MWENLEMKIKQKPTKSQKTLPCGMCPYRSDITSPLCYNSNAPGAPVHR